MNLERFMVRVQETISTHPCLREGQILFNVLSEEEPEWANEIRSTDSDPFYNDKKIPAFWEWLTIKIAAESA